jgi:hypothetical protein
VLLFLTFTGTADLTLAALHRIYIEDFSQESGSFPQTSFEAVQPCMSAYKHHCDQSPALTCASSVSSASSTPCVLPTPPSMSPEFEPEIACQNDLTKTVHHTASVAHFAVTVPKAQPVARTQSLPSNYQHKAAASHPVMEDKTSLRWFLTELLRRSRASASVVQLALHYLTQARMPVGEILAHKFKSVSDARIGSPGKDQDSPLLDPRRLLLAALMLSTKILHDHAPNNRAWARVCGLDARDVSACERALGQALNWELAHMFVGPLDQSVVLE